MKVNSECDMDDFDKARWLLIKNCEMNAKRSLDPELQKMAQNVIIDPWAEQKDWREWLAVLSRAMQIDIGLYSYLFLVRGCGTNLVENTQYGLTGKGWSYTFKPTISPDLWLSKEVFNDVMSDLFNKYGNQTIYEILVGTWKSMKELKKQKSRR